ncbi:hypothetical protein QUF64_16425 [Anaerolineales bacterium HSG6]|nr:hypothetical protein [Anaerolineales bacterium HSG6]
MDKTVLQQYRKRWDRVAQVELAEQRQTSIQQRWQQLNLLFQLATELALLKQLHAQDEDVVWQRWTRLRTVLT